MMRVDWMSTLGKLELKTKGRACGENDIRAVPYWLLESQLLQFRKGNSHGLEDP